MKNRCSDCCSPEIQDSNKCGCCTGIRALTPLATSNRPGLARVACRIGTHADFLSTMLARLSSHDFPELAGLTTRNNSDPAIALLDGWATVADVLTFYQERIANEGYLRTATERRSILELAKLVGYRPRPGVAASVFLAYTIDAHTSDEITIPAGSRAQSIPGPDEQPQSFETSEDLKARAEWNLLRPRMTRPQTKPGIEQGTLYLRGIKTNLKLNEPLLIDFGDYTPPVLYRVSAMTEDIKADRTRVAIIPWQQQGIKTAGPFVEIQPLQAIMGELARRPSLQPSNALGMHQNLSEQFTARSEASYAALASFSPLLRETLFTALANVRLTGTTPIRVYRFTVKAHLFGHNVPRRTEIPHEGGIAGDGGDWPIIEIIKRKLVAHEEETTIYLDASYDAILPGSWLVVQTSKTSRLTDERTCIATVKKVDAEQTRAQYGVSTPTTRIEMGFLPGEEARWVKLTKSDGTLKSASNTRSGDDFNILRSTRVFARPEELTLAEEPITESLGRCGDQPGDIIELDSCYQGIKPGRWVIVSGERDIAGTSGVMASEPAMIAAVTQDAHVGAGNSVPAGEHNHTFLRLARHLEYCFKRDTVTIHGNVVRATHGETHHEVLGNGDAGKEFQQFSLKRFPLTHVPAANPAGVTSTLDVFVNDVRWHETDSLYGLDSTERRFVTRTDNEDRTTVVFGNGRQGLRLPTGIENVRVRYRSGIGQVGNVRTGQISLLVSKPLGVREVVNPLRASGGADRESRDQARENAPLAVRALDRLVSVQDYEDFARVYAGIGKAQAVEIQDGRQSLVHVTVAGADDIPIDETSDLYLNLRQALHDFGDPWQPVLLSVRELMMVVLSAGIRLLPDFQWEPVVGQVRSVLLDAFGFGARKLGQDLLLSEVVSVIQSVHGVAYVDVDGLDAVPERVLDAETSRWRLVTPGEIAEMVSAATRAPKERIRVRPAGLEEGEIRPARLALLAPDMPETLILNQIK